MEPQTQAPLLSVDPKKQILEYGFPLYRFQESCRVLKYYPEKQVIPRTNDFRPTSYVMALKDVVVPQVTFILQEAPEFRDFSRADLTKIVSDDVLENRYLEHNDPLKGNSFAAIDYLNEYELQLFSTGPSMSSLVILLSRKQEFKIAQHNISLPYDKINIKNIINLKYSIRQITISPLSTCCLVVFIVRTSCSLHLFSMDENQYIKQVHHFKLADQVQHHPNIDYSMPIHVELSPYELYQYLFITNSGYVSLIDGSKQSVLFEQVDPIPDHIKYVSRWRSCAFGKTPHTILIASPECIKEWELREGVIETNILASPNDRIVAFRSSIRSLLYCFVTSESVIVMDSLLPERPVLTWAHNMRDATPTEVVLEKLEFSKWRITVFSHETQHASMIEFVYSNRPQQSISPQVKVLGKHNIVLSKYRFQDINDQPSHILTVGFTMKRTYQQSQDSTSGNVIFSVYRLFEDGSLRVQYIGLSPEKSDILDMDIQPQYKLEADSPKLNLLIKNAKLAMIPSIWNGDRSLAELQRIDMEDFHNYLQMDVTPGSEQELSDNFKTQTASKVRQLKSPTVVRHLFNDEEQEEQYQTYGLENLKDFLEEMEVHEKIERTRQINIPGIFNHGKPQDIQLHQQLQQAHAKEIQLSRLIIRPLPEDDDDDTNQFQYLPRQDINFTSTTTSKVLANCWKIDDVRHDLLVFPEYDTNSVPVPEVFPSVSIYKRTSDQLDVPDISFAPDNNDLSPMVVQASSATPTAHRHKSNKMTASLPVLEDTSTRRRSSMTSALHQSLSQEPTSKSFADVSTQPLPGAFASRKKTAATKKKKKPKTSGFK